MKVPSSSSSSSSSIIITIVLGGIAALAPASLACDGCFGPVSHVQHVRHVRRMQPGAQDALYGPRGPLEWGQLNVLHTTDTHGWLEGHIKEANYGADWGDFVSFARHMKHRAGNMGVDLLLVDTGDLHDGTGLSDTTTPDGENSNKVFEELNDYDLLTIGNHELYLSDVAYQVFNDFSRFWGDRYLTSNLQIRNNATGEYEYIGNKYKYFTTKKGLRIMAFGILFDFSGATNVTKVVLADDLVREKWFADAINTYKPVDMFLLLGHNPARPTDSSSTFDTIHKAIRAAHPTTPIQIFGGHSHVRDFAVIDESSTALESGRYCETLGWFSMSGFDKSNSGYNGVKNPQGVPNPTRKATNTSTSSFVYSRRYLDWNRYTFEYHAVGKKDDAAFDYHSGERVTAEITAFRQQQGLDELYGCVPENYCQTCVPFEADNNIFTVLADAMATAVVNESRAHIPRLVISNTGGIRFDMFKGPFTYDDNFIVSPFRDVFLYVPEVPWSKASTLLDQLNAGPSDKKRSAHLPNRFASMPLQTEACPDPVVGPLSPTEPRDRSRPRGITRRQESLTDGYTTTDDFGTDGDDTAHSEIPHYSVPSYFQGKGGFPNGGEPDVVDVVFVDFIESYVTDILGAEEANVACYVDCNFTSQDFLIPYVQKKWQEGLPNCAI